MSANIHAVALVLNGARDSAHRVGGLEHDRLGPTVANQFQRGCQARRSCTDDDYSFHVSRVIHKSVHKRPVRQSDSE